MKRTDAERWAALEHLRVAGRANRLRAERDRLRTEVVAAYLVPPDRRGAVPELMQRIKALDSEIRDLAQEERQTRQAVAAANQEDRL